MSDILDRARAALDGVTEGPWAIDPLGLGLVGDISTEDGSQCVAQAQQIAFDDKGLQPIRLANARFIAAARHLVPEMAAEIDRLRRALAALEQNGTGT